MKNRTVETEYDLGDVVYMRMAKERDPGMVTALFVTPLGIMLQVTWGECSVTNHYAIELTDSFVPDWEEA